MRENKTLVFCYCFFYEMVMISCFVLTVHPTKYKNFKSQFGFCCAFRDRELLGNKSIWLRFSTGINWEWEGLLSPKSIQFNVEKH